MSLWTRSLLAVGLSRCVKLSGVTAIALSTLIGSSASAIDWLGGTSTWSDDLFWSSGFAPGPGEDVWINANGGSEITFDVPSATISELRLGNGADNQLLNIPSGTLTVTAESPVGNGTPSWSGRWSQNTTTRISGTGAIVISNLAQKVTPYFIAGNQGPGGDQGNTQDSQFIVEGNGRLEVQDGGSLPDIDGVPTAGDLTVASWREAVANITVADSGIIDVARNFLSNSGELNLTQTGGTINVGHDFYLDRFDAVDGFGLPAIGTGLLSGGAFNVTNNLHVTESGQGSLTVSDSAIVSIGNTLKVNAINTLGGDGSATLSIINGGVVETELWEIPTAAQIAADVQSIDITGGLLIVRDSAVETTTETLPIADNVADWVARGYLSGSLSATVNADPGLVADGFVGNIAYARDPGTGYLNLWTAEAGVQQPGDANGDGSVDLLDLDILGSNFGVSPASLSQGDFNGDNVVDLLDLDILGSNFGAMASASIAVPEPGAATLLCGMLLAAAFRTSSRR